MSARVESVVHVAGCGKKRRFIQRPASGEKSDGEQLHFSSLLNGPSTKRHAYVVLFSLVLSFYIKNEEEMLSLLYIYFFLKITFYLRGLHKVRVRACVQPAEPEAICCLEQ